MTITTTGTRAARRLIAVERPLAILGTGGYVCVPLFLAARAARVPTAIYLPDVVPGLAVRLLARLATLVACNVEDSARYFRLQVADCRLEHLQSAISNLRSAMCVTGYPVRHELFALDHVQQVEHVLVQHVPRTDLLFDHVEAGLFDIHLSSRWKNK